MAEPTIRERWEALSDEQLAKIISTVTSLKQRQVEQRKLLNKLQAAAQEVLALRKQDQK